MRKTLVLILGPTGVGKTELALRVAAHYGSPIVSCDSRQLFREIPIGTAAPTAEEQARVKHYFIGTRSVTEDYSAGQYERDALALLEELFREHDVVVATGGSMLYADALSNGLDDLPAVPDAIRRQVERQKSKAESREEWLAWLQSEVQRLDPEYWEIVDRQNPARLRHCIEICLTTGRTYSSLRTSVRKERPFRIIKVGIERPRAELYARIDRRVQQMMDDGLLAEAQKVYPFRHLAALQTVGYRELFAYIDGEYDLARAIERIQQNSRHYAKRQMTWFRRDEQIHWLNAQNDYETNIHIIDNLLHDDSMQTR
ncbi:MAG: tRNA (adenosine(37)-N6)-dimethylallyltransferase MiaA [Paludibacteraceae bacterium]|nr:tRNA (adenosine(37)-N6)-dimethylallyltransferase MiaA [Paludibacteraceae bacterium]